MKFFGRNIKLSFKSPVQKDREIGASGTTIFGGSITDEDYVNELTGSAAIGVYEKMRKSDGIVKSALLACELPIRAANWWIEPASEDEGDKEVADFISENLFNKMSITWDDFLRQALMMLPFGFMVFEKVFKAMEYQGKNMIGWRKFAPRLPATIYKWQTAEGKDGVTQMLPNGKQPSIPIEKLLIFTHKKEGDNWVGISTLRNAYRSWFFKEHIEKINAIAFERQGLGIPYVDLPQGYTDKDYAKAKVLLKNLRANEQGYMIKPKGWEVDFMDMKAKTVKDPDSTIRRYNREILSSVLAQFMDLGSGPTGSRSLSVDQSSTFHNNLTATARQVADVINKYAIKQLVDLNYTVEEYPELKFSKIGIVPYDKIAKALASMVQQGVIKPDDNLEDTVRQLMDLPEKPEEEEEKPKPKEEPKEKEMEEKIEASEFVSWRPLTFAEQKVNFADIQRKMNETENRLRVALKKILSKSSNDLIRQMQIVLETPSSSERRTRLAKMSVRYQGEYRKEVFSIVKELFEYGKMMAAHEMKKSVPANPATSVQDMSKQADALALIMADGLMKAGKLALLLGRQQKRSVTDTLSKLTKAIRREASSISFNVPAIAVNGAINQGRRASFKVYDKDIYALQRSEILDNVTCNYCMSIDSRVFPKNASFTKNDGIHSNCRGIWVEIMKEEPELPAITGIPKELQERFETINVFKPPRVPIIKKASPAADFLKTQATEFWAGEERDLEEEKKIVAEDKARIEKEKKELGEKKESLVNLGKTIKDVLKDGQGEAT